MKTIASIIFLTSLFLQLIGQEVTSFKTSDGETLFFTKIGNGPRVILLYGGPGPAVNAMRPWADTLKNENECFLFDQRGTGLSVNVKLDSTTINLERAVSDLDDLRQFLGEDQLTLCGISWGAMLAQAYAAYYPDKTKKIVLVSTLGPDLSLMTAFTDNRTMRRFQDLDSIKYWNEQPDSEYSEMKRKFFTFLSEFYDRKEAFKMMPEFIAGYASNKTTSSLMWKDLYKVYDLKSRLPLYKGESIIIRPRQDAVPAESIFQIKEVIPQTRIFFIEKCGHLTDLEKPAELFRILGKVL